RGEIAPDRRNEHHAQLAQVRVRRIDRHGEIVEAHESWVGDVDDNGKVGDVGRVRVRACPLERIANGTASALKCCNYGTRGLVRLEKVEGHWCGVSARADVVEAHRHLTTRNRRLPGIARPERPSSARRTSLADCQRRTDQMRRRNAAVAVAVAVEDRWPTK